MAVTIGSTNVTNIVESGVPADTQLYIDVGNNGKDDGDIGIGLTKAELQTLLGGSTATGPVTLDQLLMSIDTAMTSTATGTQINSKLTELSAILNKVIDKLTASTDPASTAALENIKAKLLVEAKDLIKKFDETTTKSVAEKSAFNSILKNINEASGANLTSADNPAAAQTPAEANNSGKAAQQPTGGGYSYSNSSTTGGGPMGGFGGGSFGLQGGGNDFMNNYLASTYNDNNIMNNWDSIGKNQAEQKKMMMLFFYFARMAASGDMGAMYRFMQFINWIVSKNKALANINMASKVIELENKNSAALQLLLDQPVPETGDTKGQYEFTRIMETTKAAQSSIATSQKLISQMMEEMSQVVESLTSSTMEALHANGRIMRLVSRSG